MYDGGAIFNNWDGTLTVTGSVFSGNAIVNITEMDPSGLVVNCYDGGAIYDAGGTSTITDSTFSNNSAVTYGGALCSFNGVETITGCTFTDNSSDVRGNAISDWGTITATNCTVANNTSASPWGGDGVAAIDNPEGDLVVTDCTVANNGGIGILNNDITIVNNTIIANNIGGDFSGTLNVQSKNNLIGNGTGIENPEIDPSNLVGTTANPINPLLGPLQANGGPTQTMALLPGSPAIDAGSNALIPAGVTTDQRGAGFPRVVNGTVDIGAFESSGFTITVTSGSGQSTGPLTAFSAPLVATVTANNPSEPVAGGLVTFTTPPSGASATFSGSPATISATGTASVTATANSIVGSYTVSATASGITTPASFSLTNMWVPTFSALTSPTIVYGTSTTTLTGHLGSGTAYPTGSNVSITLNSVTQTASVDGSGDFTTTFSTGSLGVAGGPYTVTYAFAGNSAFTADTDTSTTLTVTAAPLTASILGDPTKTYDGTTSATLTQANFSPSGLVGTQSFTVTQTVGTYNSKDVTAATTVMASLSPSDFTPGSGTLASNYILPTTASGAGTITPKALTYSGLSAPASRVYDGTTTAEVSGAAALQTVEAAGTGSTADDKPYSVDSVSLTGTPTGTYNSKDVATATTVTFGGLALTGEGNGDYTLTASTQAATITPKALTYSGLSVPASKVYDGTTTAEVSGTAALQTAEAAGIGSSADGKPYSVDSVSLTGTPTGTYNSKDVATATTVTFGGLALTGTGNGDYTLTASTQAGTITPKALTYSGLSVPASKVYDGTTTAEVSGTAALQAAEAAGTGSSADGKPYSVDSVSLTGTPTGTYNSKDVATATTVTFGGLSLTGTGNGDYTLTASTQAGTITPKALTYSGLSVPASKVYDGTTTAEVSGTAALQTAEAAGTGTSADGKPYSVDSVSLTGTPTGTYNSKDVATATTVTFGGLALTGTGNGDYTLTASTQAATITPRTVTASIVGDPTKTYNGSTSATLSPSNFSLTGVISGESFTVTQTAGTYNSKDVSTATTVTASLSAGNFTPGSGTLASDYTLPTTASGAGNINPALLTVTAANESMTYGGTVPTLTYTYTGLVNGDTITNVTETSIGAGSLTTVGTYPIILSAATGTGLSNYTISYVDGTLTVTPAPLTVTATDQSTTYGSTVPAMTYTYSGLVNNDTSVVLNGSLATTATSSSSVGDYAITQGTLVATGNYTIGTYNPSILTIAKADTIVTVTPYGVTYDGNVHNATGTSLTGLVINSAHINAGTYTDNWTYIDPNGNYNSQTGIITDTIAKANASISVIGYNTFYNAVSHIAIGAVYGVNGVASVD